MTTVFAYLYSAALLFGLVYALYQILAKGVDGALDTLIIPLPGREVAISMLAVSWFVSAFGGTGVATLVGLQSRPLQSVVAALIGGLLLGIIAQGMFLISMWQTETIQSSQADLLGKEAEVTTPIPSGKAGQILILDIRVQHAARAISREMTLGRGQKVRIMRIVGGVAYVEPI